MRGTQQKISAIIVAAGKGVRFGRDDKMFAPLRGRSLLYYSLQTMAATPEVGEVVVAVGRKKVVVVQDIIDKGGFRKVKAVVPGGRWRGESVLRALEALPRDTDWVLVHDAARPLASPGLVKKIIRACGSNDALTVATLVTDTVMRAGKQMSVDEVVERKKLYTVQTPQLMRYEMLLKYHYRAAKAGLKFSDDLGLFLKYGGKLKLIEGERTNIKVTYKEDLAMVEGLLSR